MQVICQDCLTSFQFPADRIPRGKEIWVICPNCHSPRALSHLPPHPAPALSPGAETESGPPRLNPMQEGVRAALLCMTHDEPRMQVEQALSNLTYTVNRAQTGHDALSSLQANDYQVLILEETWAGSAAEENLVLRYVQTLPMQARRQLFFCLMSETVATLDELAALRFCANLVINAQDLDKTEVLLRRCIADYHDFYKIIWQEQNRLS